MCRERTYPTQSHPFYLPVLFSPFMFFQHTGVIVVVSSWPRFSRVPEHFECLPFETFGCEPILLGDSSNPAVPLSIMGLCQFLFCAEIILKSADVYCIIRGDCLQQTRLMLRFVSGCFALSAVKERTTGYHKRS